MPGDKQAEGEWGVFDRNAYLLDEKGNTQTRTHTVRPGKNYLLRNDQPCWMPEADARTFLKDEAFVVWNQDEEVVPPLMRNALDRNKPAKLEPDQVIASLDELTNDALLTRAAQRQGGNKFSPDTRREALVRFLADAQGGADATTTRPARAPQVAAPDDPGVDDFDDEEDAAVAAKMLEGA